MSWRATAHLIPARLGLAVGEADRCHLRRRKDHSGDDRFVRAHRVALEGVERRDAAFIGRDGRELSAPCRVTCGVNMGNGGAKIRRDLEPEPCGFEPEPLCPERPRVEAPPRAHTNRRAGNLPPAFEARGDRPGPAIKPCDGRVQPEGHPLALEDLAQVARDVARKVREDLVIAADHGDRGAKVAKSARHLEPDGPGAYHREAPGKIGQEEQIVGRDGELATGDVENDGLRTGGDDDLLPGQTRAVHFDGVRVEETRAAQGHSRARLL